MSSDLRSSVCTARKIPRNCPDDRRRHAQAGSDDVQERQNKEGVSSKQAAYEEAAKTASGTKDRGQGGFAGFGEFYKQLQGSQDKKDPYAVATADNTRKLVESNERIISTIIQRRNQDGFWDWRGVQHNARRTNDSLFVSERDQDDGPIAPPYLARGRPG